MVEKIEELTLEEFESLPDTKQAGAKVDYTAVLAEITGRPMTIGSIQKVMKANSHNKPKVYYSEVTGWLDRLSTRSTWDVRFGFGKKKYVLVTPVAPTTPSPAVSEEPDTVEEDE